MPFCWLLVEEDTQTLNVHISSSLIYEIVWIFLFHKLQLMPFWRLRVLTSKEIEMGSECISGMKP